MITNETLNTMYADDRHAAIAWRNALHSDLEALESAYNESNAPAETIDRAAAIMGADRVLELVASLVNIRADYDGRLGRDVKAWAQTVPGALDAAAAERVRLCSDTIHPAHLDQLARACKDYTPSDPEPETTEAAEQTTETTETAPAAEPEAETTKRAAEIADILDDVRCEITAGYYRKKRRVTARCLREAERAGVPTVRVGYCGAQWLLSYLTPAYYTAGVYGWNCDVYTVAGLNICTGYRGMAGEPAVLTADYERRARAAAGEDERSAILAEWIAANLDAIRTAREGVRA